MHKCARFTSTHGGAGVRLCAPRLPVLFFAQRETLTLVPAVQDKVLREYHRFKCVSRELAPSVPKASRSILPDSPAAAFDRATDRYVQLPRNGRVRDQFDVIRDLAPFYTVVR